MDKSLTFRIEIYTANKPLETVDKTINAKEVFTYTNPNYDLVLKEVIDDSSSEEPKVTFKMYDKYIGLSDEQKNAVTVLENKLSNTLNSYTTSETQEIKIADPNAINISDWTEAKATQTALGYGCITASLGLQWSILESNNIISNSFYSLLIRVYEDAEMTREKTGNFKFDETYYIGLSYEGTCQVGNTSITSKAVLSSPIPVVLKSVEPDKDAANQLRRNVNQNNDPIDIYYDDLSWANILSFTGNEPAIPLANHADSMLYERDPKTYKNLVGNTDLHIKVFFGGSGVNSYMSKCTSGGLLYYVDNVFYWQGAYSTIYMNNVLYVGNNAKNIEKAAEDRLNAYFETDDITVTELNGEGFLNELRKANTGIDRSFLEDFATSAYITDSGIIFYYFDQSENKDILVDGMNYPIENMGLLSSNKIIAGDKSGTYQPYKVSMNGHDYVFLIAKVAPGQLKKAYANWKDEKTDIISQGANGNMPIDTYTKVDPVTDEEDLIIIKDKFGNETKIDAYDITAHSNFKDGEFTDLGNGRMKICVPIGNLDPNSIKVYHYDDVNKKVTDEQFTLTKETIDGIEYICFEVTHFSVYGIAGTESKSATGTSNNNSTIDATETGDSTNILFFTLLATIALIALTVTFFFRRKVVNGK